MEFSLDKKQYNIKNNFYDISIKEAASIVDIKIEKDRLDYLLDNDNLEYDDDIMDYIIDVIVILSDAPKAKLKQSSKEGLCVLFLLVKAAVLKLYRFNFENYDPIGIVDITHRGKRYFMPPSLKVNDDEVLFFKEPAKNVLEVSNLMRVMEDMEEKGIKLLNYICAIYLRENVDELYDDEKVNKRAEIFKDLPIYVGFEVFFYTYVYICNWLIASRIYLEAEKKKTLIGRIRSLIHGFFKSLKVRWLKMWKRLKR